MHPALRSSRIAKSMRRRRSRALIDGAFIKAHGAIPKPARSADKSKLGELMKCRR